MEEKAGLKGTTLKTAPFIYKLRGVVKSFPFIGVIHNLAGRRIEVPEFGD